jgi:hypothetical protein
MQILCIGDIAIADEGIPALPWVSPVKNIPDDEVKVLCNWELPIGKTLNPIPRISGPRLVSNPNSLEVFQSWAPSFATLATNHILDAGEEGLIDTLTQLHKTGCQTIGAGLSNDEIRRPLIWETGEGKLALLNWVFPETHPECDVGIGPNCWPGLVEAEATVKSLKKQAQWVIVLAHWSDELFSFPRPEDRLLAHQLAGMGVDMIISHHPHVVRGMENIGSCPVFYSLGNYFFSNFKNSQGEWIVQNSPRNREGLGVLVKAVRTQGLSYEMIAFIQVDQQTMIDPQDKAVSRVKSTSAPFTLNQAEYEEWYREKRHRFDRWWGRWHFGVRRMGIRGLMAKVIFGLH